MKSIMLVGSLGMLLAVSGAVYGNGTFVFTANLGGAQEVLGQPPFLAPQPGIETETAGRFRIRFDRALMTAQFRLSVDQGAPLMAGWNLRTALHHSLDSSERGKAWAFKPSDKHSFRKASASLICTPFQDAEWRQFHLEDAFLEHRDRRLLAGKRPH